jgi:ribosomal-protein-serine acetyltransferase
MLVAIPRTDLCQHPLITARLELKPLELADEWELLEAVDASRAELQRFLPWTPYVTTREQAQHYCDASEREWDQARGYRFLLRDRGSRLVLGVVGFENIVNAHDSADFGYWLRTSHVGRGLMREGAAAAVDWAFATVGLHRIRVAAAAENHASLHVIHALRFYFEGTAREAEWCDGRWLNHRVYSRLRDD